MNRHFSYPVNLRRAKEGGYLIEFFDLPEAITQGNTDSIEEALNEAADCLEEAIANRMIMKLDIPKPSKPKKSQHIVLLHAALAAKAALYLSMKQAKLSNSAFAKKLHCDEKEVRRLLDPHYASKLPRIEFALEKLGLRLAVGVTNSFC